MKRFYVHALVLAFCITAATGCSKNEGDVSETSSKVAAARPDPNPPTIRIPNDNKPEPGKEPKTSLKLPIYNSTAREIQYPFTRIENPSPNYIAETCLFDISHLEDGKTYHQVNNKNLNIAFFSTNSPIGDVLKMSPNSPEPFGWTAHWGNPPHVEKEHPDVLFVDSFEQVVLVLSKPCIEFGVEIAPNIQNKDFYFDAYFGEYTFDGSSALINQKVQTPSGARLFAVKATQPFTTVTIHWDRRSSINQGSDGWALANIRYKLAKK